MGESESCEAPFTSDVSEGVGSKSFLRSPRCAAPLRALCHAVQFRPELRFLRSCTRATCFPSM